MPLDLKKLKSAEVIEGPDKVSKRLADMIEKRAKEQAGFLGHTVICNRDDGPSVIAKASAFSLKETEVKANAELGTPSVDTLRQLAQKRGRKWKDGLEKRALPYWGSDERPDGHGDIVRQNWLFDEFEKNSPMPYSHEWHKLPIGNILSWKVLDRAEPDYKGAALWLLGLFSTFEESQRADEVFRLAEAGVLRGGSVGFYSTKLIDVKDEAERAKLGLGRWGLILDQNHLLEFSPTTLGANAGALTILSRAKSRGLLKATDFDVIRELARQEVIRSKAADIAEQWEEKDGTYLAFAKMLFRDHDFKEHSDVMVPFESDEERRLKHYPVPSQKAGATTEEQLGELRQQVRDLSNTVQEMAVSNTQTLSDIRSLLEKAASAAPAPEQKEPAGGAARGKEETKETGDSSDPYTNAARKILGALPAVQE